MMGDNINGLGFSEVALSNRTLFLSSLNDINIYVEDVGKEYEYEEIFERLFKDEISIFSIFPLGGKGSVLKEFHLRGSHDRSGKVNIYIVDGDFDNLWDDQKVLSPYLIYLSRYNIESYYCSKNAIVKFMRYKLKCTRNTVEKKVHFDEWRNTVCRNIGRLFVLFAVVNRYCPEMPNIRLGIGRFIDKNGCLSDDELIKYYKEVKATLRNVDNLIAEINERIHTQFGDVDDEGIYSIVCGKYQFESLCRSLKLHCGKNICREEFRNYLISNFDLAPLLYIRNQIIQLLSGSVSIENSAS